MWKFHLIILGDGQDQKYVSKNWATIKSPLLLSEYKNDQNKMYYVKQNSGDKENKGFLATESEADVNLPNIYLAYL